MTPELEIELPAKPEFVRMVRHTVGAMARLHDVPDELVDDIKLAVSEACTTAVGSAEGTNGQLLTIRAWADDERMTVEVVDPVSVILREVLGRPSELDTEDLPFERALALPVIRGLVDEVGVTPHASGGTTLRMVISAGPPAK